MHLSPPGSPPKPPLSLRVQKRFRVFSNDRWSASVETSSQPVTQQSFRLASCYPTTSNGAEGELRRPY